MVASGNVYQSRQAMCGSLPGGLSPNNPGFKLNNPFTDGAQTMNYVTKFSLAGLFLAFALSGCGTTGDTGSGGAPVESRDSSQVVPVEAGNTQTRGLPRELTDPNSILSKRSVYFDLDKYNISEQYRVLVNAHAKFLTEHRQFRILIQGNTDERGSREYNLALGQKRAEAVRRALTLLGARDTQIEAVSLGEEKPACTAATEDCYAQNRRGDLQYPTR
jgi:peptidoglycan-associated lipoprotein